MLGLSSREDFVKPPAPIRLLLQPNLIDHIILPLGSNIGNSRLFTTVGDWVTWQMKGKQLFIPKYRKAFRL